MFPVIFEINRLCKSKLYYVKNSKDDKFIKKLKKKGEDIMKNFEKYRKLYDWKKPKNRTWMDCEITKAPIWCSVDLRDGNQALANPMTMDEKITFFDHLVKIGFKEIEIGFPAASETEYKFTRYLIENDKIPEDVTIQVLTQSREEIIAKTFQALDGAKNAIVHLYNSTSKIQRDVVFGKNKEEVKKVATDGAELLVKYIEKYPETNWSFEYSPESFSTTEMDYAVEVINAVIATWKGKTKNKIIINLPATIECAMPNVFADQVAYVQENIVDRENVIISIHSHNDRGTGVATSEMSLLAGADRIEGALFGNGERTGNADILNIAMNMYVLGVDPQLDFSHINETKRIYETVTKMQVEPRHPYAGELVFTAFSGSHQDAISKGLKAIKKEDKKYWEVPYLPINPADVNRQYEPIIRINSQSGKGGVSFILENKYGYILPKEMKKEVGYFIKEISDKSSKELEDKEIYDTFVKEYENRQDTISFVSYEVENVGEVTKLIVKFKFDGKEIEKTAEGNGPIDAFTNILKNLGYEFSFKNYKQESYNESQEKSSAITYIDISNKGNEIWAVGKDEDVVKSSFLAMISAMNRMKGRK